MSSNYSNTQGEKIVREKLAEATLDEPRRATAGAIDARANAKWELAKDEASIAATATKLAAKDAKDALLGKSSATVASGQDNIESTTDTIKNKAYEIKDKTVEQANIISNKVAIGTQQAANKLDQAKVEVQHRAHDAVEQLSNAADAGRHMAQDAIIAGKELLHDAAVTIRESAENMWTSGKQVAQEVPGKVREVKDKASSIIPQSNITTSSANISTSSNTTTSTGVGLKQKVLEVKEEVRQLAQDAALKTAELLNPSRDADPAIVERGKDAARRHEQVAADAVDTVKVKTASAVDTVKVKTADTLNRAYVAAQANIEGATNQVNQKLFPTGEQDTSDPRNFRSNETEKFHVQGDSVIIGGAGGTKDFSAADPARSHVDGGNSSTTTYQLHSDLLTRPADPDVVQRRADTGDAKFDF